MLQKGALSAWMPFLLWTTLVCVSELQQADALQKVWGDTNSRQRGSVPTASPEMILTSLDGAIILYGGWQKSDSNAIATSNDLYKWDPQKKIGSKIASGPSSSSAIGIAQIGQQRNPNVAYVKMAGTGRHVLMAYLSYTYCDSEAGQRAIPDCWILGGCDTADCNITANPDKRPSLSIHILDVTDASPAWTDIGSSGSAAGSAPEALFGFAVAGTNGKFYIFGGRGADSDFNDVLSVFNIAEMSWSNIMPGSDTPRVNLNIDTTQAQLVFNQKYHAAYSHSMTAQGNSLYFTNASMIWQYDIASGVWSKSGMHSKLQNRLATIISCGSKLWLVSVHNVESANFEYETTHTVEPLEGEEAENGIFKEFVLLEPEGISSAPQCGCLNSRIYFDAPIVSHNGGSENRDPTVMVNWNKHFNTLAFDFGVDAFQYYPKTHSGEALSDDTYFYKIDKDWDGRATICKNPYSLDSEQVCMEVPLQKGAISQRLDFAAANGNVAVCSNQTYYRSGAGNWTEPFKHDWQRFGGVEAPCNYIISDGESFFVFDATQAYRASGSELMWTAIGAYQNDDQLQFAADANNPHANNPRYSGTRNWVLMYNWVSGNQKMFVYNVEKNRIFAVLAPENIISAPVEGGGFVGAVSSRVFLSAAGFQGKFFCMTGLQAGEYYTAGAEGLASYDPDSGLWSDITNTIGGLPAGLPVPGQGQQPTDYFGLMALDGALILLTLDKVSEWVYAWNFRTVPVSEEMKSSSNLLFDLLFAHNGDVVCLLEPAMLDGDVELGVGTFPTSVTVKGCKEDGSLAVIQRSGASSTLLCQEGSTCSQLRLENVLVQCEAFDASPFVQMVGKTELQIDATTFKDCKSPFAGVLASYGGTLAVSNSRFEDLEGSLGAAISAQGGSLRSSNNNFVNCIAQKGGAIHAKPLTLVQITNSVAAVVENDVDMLISGDHFVDCVSEEGGAVWIEKPKPLKLESSKFHNCQATGTGGGAIYLKDGASAELTANEFVQCRASTGGGALLWIENAPSVSGGMDSLCQNPSNGNTAAWAPCYGSNAKRLLYSMDKRPYRTGIPIADESLPDSEQRDAFVVQLVDEYGHILNSENAALVELLSSNNFQYDQLDANIQLTGTSIQMLSSGEVSFGGVTISTSFAAIDYVNGKTVRVTEPKLYFQSQDPFTGNNVVSSIFQLPMANDSEVCGMGYILALDGSVGRCQACEAGTYSRNPLRSPITPVTFAACFSCPEGAQQCYEGFKVDTPVDEDWQEEDGAVRVVGCPRGKILVRGARPNVHLDQCIECSAESYSVHEAVFIPENPLWVEAESAAQAFQLAQGKCQQCSDYATCNGGTHFEPLKGFWKKYEEWEETPWRRQGNLSAEDLEISIYKCPPNSCLEGGQCEDFHTGPICGRCNDTAVMTPSGCEECVLENLVVAKALAGVGGAIAFVLVWYWFVWKRLLDDIRIFAMFNALIYSAMTCYVTAQDSRGSASSKLGAVAGCFSWISRAFASVQKDLQGFIKIIISFYQVVSSFSSTFKVEWPEKISSVYRATKIFQLDFLTLPGPACLTIDWSYTSKLLSYTVSPLVVVPLIGLPAGIAIVLGKMHHGGPLSHPKYDDVVGQFWYSLLFFLYLLYPAVSVATLQSFSCTYLDEHGDWLKSDFREPCPLNNPGGTVFVWSFICVFLYPIGIPVFFLVVLYAFKVPQMAAQKINIQNLQALINMYRRQNVTSEGESILLHMSKLSSEVKTGKEKVNKGHKICTNRVVQEFFRRIDVDGNGEITLEELSQYMKNEHLCEGLGESSELVAIVKAATKNGSGGMSLATFRAFCKDLEHKHSLFTGTDIPVSLGIGSPPISVLSRKQLEALAFHDWSFDEGSGFATDFGSIVQEQADGKPSTTDEEVEEQIDEQERLPKKTLRNKVMAIVRDLTKHGIIVLPSMAWDGALEGEQDALNKVGFLFTMYEVPHYYFETIEMTRKLLITSILVFVYPGEPAQLAAGVVISFSSLIIYYSARPFVSDRLDTLQIFSLITQCVNLFYGIMLIVVECPANQGPRKSPFIEVLVVLMNTCIVAVPVFQTASENFDTFMEMLPEEMPCAPGSNEDPGLEDTIDLENEEDDEDGEELADTEPSGSSDSEIPTAGNHMGAFPAHSPAVLAAGLGGDKAKPPAVAQEVKSVGNEEGEGAKQDEKPEEVHSAQKSEKSKQPRPTKAEEMKQSDIESLDKNAAETIEPRSEEPESSLTTGEVKIDMNSAHEDSS